MQFSASSSSRYCRDVNSATFFSRRPVECDAELAGRAEDEENSAARDSERAAWHAASSRQPRAIVETGHESVGHNTRVALRGVLREVARMRALAAAAGAFDEEQLAHAERDAANPNHSAEVRRLFEARAANLRRKQESLSSSSSSRHDAGGDVEDPLVDAMLRESAALLQCGPCAPCDER